MEVRVGKELAAGKKNGQRSGAKKD